MKNIALPAFFAFLSIACGPASKSSDEGKTPAESNSIATTSGSIALGGASSSLSSDDQEGVATADKLEAQGSSIEVGQAMMSERGLIVIAAVASDPASYGDSIGRLEEVPTDSEMLISVASEFIASKGLSWPGEVTALAERDQLLFFSAVPTKPEGNDFDTGYLVDTKTGDVRQYHLW